MSHTKFVLAAVVCCLLSTALTAQQPGIQRNTRQRPYQVGEINLETSRVYTHVYKKTSLGHEHGIEGRVKSGAISLSTSTGEIVFDMQSFQADTLAARKYVGLKGETDASTKKSVQGNMVGTSILNVKQFPTATFAITSIQPMKQASRQGLPQFKLSGTFELRGEKRSISVLATTEEKNGWTHLKGGFRIKQTDYGIKPFTKAFGAIGIADEITIYGDFWVGGTLAQLANLPTTKR